jgi:hypothetical protein
VFQNREPRKILGSKRKEVKEATKYCVIRSFMICILHQILWGWRVKSRRMWWVVHVV